MEEGEYIFKTSLYNLILHLNLDEAMPGVRRVHVHAEEHVHEQRLRSGLSFSFRSCYGCWPRVIGFDRAACEILLFCFHVFYSFPDTPLAHQRIARALDR